MFERSIYQEVYARIAGAVAYVTVESPRGDHGIGSAFHIGDGVFVTARHVVDGQKINQVATTKSARHANDPAQGILVRPQAFSITDGPYFGSTELDVAVFRVDLAGNSLPKIEVSPYVEYDIRENDLELSDVLIIEYPPIPFTLIPYQIVALGQINAVVRVRHSPVLHMIASTMARGGFSGGVAVDKNGVALGLVTESLGNNQFAVETGYMSLLSIEAAIDLVVDRVGLLSSSRVVDDLIGVKMAKSETLALSTSVHDAEIYVYDDDRDIFATISCDNVNLLPKVAEAFANVVSVKKSEEWSNSTQWHLDIDGNPSAATLVCAAEAAQHILEQSGYVRLSFRRSMWQLRRRPT